MDTKELASALLDELLARLQPQATGEDPEGLGWCYPQSNTTYVFAARAADGSPWYEGVKDGDDFKQIGTDASVKGRIIKFYPYTQSSEKYGDSQKLSLTLACGNAGQFVIKVGRDSVAGHNLLMGLSQLTNGDLLQPITITPKASEQDAKVLFLGVSAASGPVNTSWDKSEVQDGYWEAMCGAVVAAFSQVLGEDAVTPPQRNELNPKFATVAPAFDPPRAVMEAFTAINEKGDLLTKEQVSAIIQSVAGAEKTAKDLSADQAQEVISQMYGSLDVPF